MKITILAAAIGATALLSLPAYAQGQSPDQQGQQQEHVTIQMEQETVRQIQMKLNQEGFNAGSVDGNWGPNTQQALRNFQEREGIDATGQPDRETLSALGVEADAFGADGNDDQQDGEDQ